VGLVAVLVNPASPETEAQRPTAVQTYFEDPEG